MLQVAPGRQAAHHAAAPPPSTHSHSDDEEQYDDTEAGADPSATQHPARKRQRHDPGQPSAAAAPALPAELDAGRFRDATFFISAEQKDRHGEEGFALPARGHSAISAAVLDLEAEDTAGMATQKRRRVWDSKKKRYVTLQQDETVKAGKRVPGKGAGGSGKQGQQGQQQEQPGRAYQQWQKAVGAKAAAGLGPQTKGGQAALASRCGVP